MFDSIWQSHIPISVSYISTSSQLKDIFVYLTLSSSQANSTKEEINTVLEENRENFNEMLRIILHLPVILFSKSVMFRRSPTLFLNYSLKIKLFVYILQQSTFGGKNIVFFPDGWLWYCIRYSLSDRLLRRDYRVESLLDLLWRNRACWDQLLW